MTPIEDVENKLREVIDVILDIRCDLVDSDKQVAIIKHLGESNFELWTKVVDLNNEIDVLKDALSESNDLIATQRSVIEHKDEQLKDVVLRFLCSDKDELRIQFVVGDDDDR